MLLINVIKQHILSQNKFLNYVFGFNQVLFKNSQNLFFIKI